MAERGLSQRRACELVRIDPKTVRREPEPDHPGVIYAGEPLPGRHRIWVAIERAALEIDVAALPRLQFVTAHATMRIVTELRREGHSLE